MKITEQELDAIKKEARREVARKGYEKGIGKMGKEWIAENARKARLKYKESKEENPQIQNC